MVENQKAQQETKTQWRERLSHIGSYWKDLSEWHEQVNKKVCRIIKKSQKIEILLRKTPTSKRVMMQSIFARLGAEADTIIDNMIDHMRINSGFIERFVKCILSHNVQQVDVECLYRNGSPYMIKDDSHLLIEHLISAPNLISLIYEGYDPLHLSTDGFHSLEKVDLYICSISQDAAEALEIVRLFQQIQSVKFLRLNLEILEPTLYFWSYRRSNGKIKSGEIMDSRHGEARMNVGNDRLSNLPDDLIHKILSLVDIKLVVQTSALSSRWRFIWTSMPYLNFSTEDFFTLPKFSKFVTHLLSRRNNIDVFSVKLRFRGKSLKHLSLTKEFDRRGSCRKSKELLTTANLELPALTTLYIDYVTLCCDDSSDNSTGLFSKCPKLENLTLNFKTIGMNGLSICHPRLTNLTLGNRNWPFFAVNVAAPQLQNLTIDDWSREHLYSIYAPDLVSLVYKGSCPLQFSTNGFHALEKADVDIFSSPGEKVHHIVHLLQQLHNVRFLTLNLHTVKLLALFVELFSNLPSPFTNLKRLKIYPQYPDEEVTLCTEVKNFLLDSSPSATLILVSHEEIKAQDLMKQLQVLLKEYKENIETNMAQMEQPKAKTQWNFGGRMAEIEGYWEDLNVQFEKGKEKTQRVISKLRKIEELLTKVHIPPRAKMQAKFYSLWAEADIIMTNMIHCMKIQFDKKPTPPNVYFYELATTSQPSS
ncbi:F-box domain, Leucine-rich repeat domain, L domain-like protein [Artemisia annua]|uniref:F-box domain, Leucine-rich repeat domain, L domain-like protein n=1 Tax=Artemisia annua TaxID=35608 RepID=A0A2U1NKJ2_ARTAN|nr:F-box domain, Leucine-rich repeat domain, L domain-like protein [Artemisia annua]